jgi:hypothetical protein
MNFLYLCAHAARIPALHSQHNIVLQNGLNMDGSYGYEDCIGLRVKPRQGDGLLFYSLLPNGTIDQVSIVLIIVRIIRIFF